MSELEPAASDLGEIRAAVERIAAKIDAPDALLPTYGTSEDFARPHIEADDRGFHFVVVERGCERERRTTRDANELLYWIFDGVTHSMASDFELKHRKGDQDCRRIAFARQLELLEKLDSTWRERKEKENTEILQRHPFDDFASKRVERFKEHKEAGIAEMEAWGLACREYPMPGNFD